MSFSEEDLNEIRQRNDIVEVISAYVTLKKMGNSYRGLCPFHGEKTPSFFVDRSKQLYHCFGCGEGGNVFSFITKKEKVEFPEAVKMLAERVGYRLKISSAEKKQVSEKDRLAKINAAAQELYSELLKSGIGKKAMEYLRKRGFSEETIEQFKLGYSAPEWDHATGSLIKKGVSLNDLLKTGISIRGNRGPYDRFRGRVMFPIFDIRDRLIGFGGRILEAQKEDEPKYLNSPETPLFHKSSTLFNLNLARSEIVKQDLVFVVEGYTDVMMMHQGGIRNAVATLGTAFTAEHMKVLSRFASNIILAFDADSAGKTAAERGLELLKETSSTVKVMTLPEDLDPADIILKEGREGFLKYAGKARLLLNFALSERINKFDLKESAQRSKALKACLEVILSLSDRVTQDDYLVKIAERLGISEDLVRLEFKKMNLGQPVAAVSASVSAPEEDPFVNAQRVRETETLKVLLQEEAIRNAFLKDIKEEHFIFQEHKNILKFIREIAEKRTDTEYSQLIDKLTGEKEKNIASSLILDKIFADDIEKYFHDLLIKLRENFLVNRLDFLKKEFKKLDPAKENEKSDALFKEILDLEKEKRALYRQAGGEKA